MLMSLISLKVLGDSFTIIKETINTVDSFLTALKQFRNSIGFSTLMPKISYEGQFACGKMFIGHL